MDSLCALCGPTIKSLINNEERLSELCEIIGEDNHEYIIHLEDLFNKG